MATAVAVAKVLDELHSKDHHGKRMDKLRMNKLLYFVQREALIRNPKEPIFPELFQGWRFGPVLTEVNDMYPPYSKKSPFTAVTDTVTRKEKKLITYIYNLYSQYPSWELNQLAEMEFSWKNSRTGIPLTENGNEIIPMDAIRVDAIRERMLRKEQELML